MNQQTVEHYAQIIKECKEVFRKKTEDYGTAWRVLRLPSITDQILIKAQRIRSIQEKGTRKVADDTNQEFKGIINYCIIAMLQLSLSNEESMELKN